MIAALPGAGASQAEHDLMDRMLDAAFAVDGPVAVIGDVDSGTFRVVTSDEPR